MRFHDKNAQDERAADDTARWLDAVVADVRARGWDGALLTALDAFEPLLPLGAQLLWVAQPALGMVGGGAQIGAWARLLESQAGVATLRARLSGNDLTPQPPLHTGEGEEK
ncbi:MAG: hypothetical protein SGI73_18395 [Chloroflexota bacterium]|nr:hypothetical protein [Chloroflexota bacterium]